VGIGDRRCRVDDASNLSKTRKQTHFEESLEGTKFSRRTTERSQMIWSGPMFSPGTSLQLSSRPRLPSGGTYAKRLLCRSPGIREKQSQFSRRIKVFSKRAAPCDCTLTLVAIRQAYRPSTSPKVRIRELIRGSGGLKVHYRRSVDRCRYGSRRSIMR